MRDTSHEPEAGQQLVGTLIVMGLLLLLIVVLWVYSYYVVVTRG